MLRILWLCALTLPCAALASPPSWWTERDTVKKTGSILTILCRGNGSAKDLAYREALNQCRSIASEHLRDAKFHINTLSIETEQSAAFHSEQSADLEISGLRVAVEKERTEQGESGEFTTYIKARVDLSKAVAKNIEQQAASDDGRSSILQEKAPAVSDGGAAYTPQAITQSQDRLVILSILPADATCSLLIRGRWPRIMKCSDQPINVLLRKGDREILIRQKGYRPKRLKVDLKQAGNETEAQNVYLEKL